MAKHLINLYQIDKGKELKDFLISYAASKVTTTIETGKTRTDENGSIVNLTYTADELLTELKNSMTTLLGDSETTNSIDNKVQTAVTTINNTTVYDYVRAIIPSYKDLNNVTILELTQDEYKTAKSTNKVNVTYDTSGNVVGLTNDELKNYQLDTPYTIYTFDNSAIVDTDGNPITITLVDDGNGNISGQLSAIPNIITTKTSNIQVTNESVTLSDDLQTLNLANTLLDASQPISVINSSGKLISSDDYYVRELSGRIYFRRQQEKTDTYTVSYTYNKEETTSTSYASYEVTQDSEKEILAWKFFPIKKCTLGTLNADYLLDNNELTEISLSVSMDKIADKLTRDDYVINQILDKCSETAVQNAINTLVNSIEDRLTKAEAVTKNLQQEITETFSPTDKQTVFNLSYVPIADREVVCYINGLFYKEDEYFTIDRTTNVSDEYTPTLTWLFDSSNDGFDLNSNYEIVVKYNKDTDKKIKSVEINSNPSA